MWDLLAGLLIKYQKGKCRCDRGGPGDEKMGEF